MLYCSWEDVPESPPSDLTQGSVFVEVFSGKAGFTKALRKRGWLVLPPIDVVVEGDVLFPADILDPSLIAKLRNWLRSGVIRLVHFGTPCTTFSRARRDDGGPPPIRSPEYLNGIPGIPVDDQSRVDMGTEFLDITISLAALATEFDAAWTIENPLSSMMWLMPQMIELQANLAAAKVEMHMCAYGALSMKPTLILCSGKHFLHLDKRCPGKSSEHKHIELKGWKWVDGKKVYLTKLAQVYPDQLCSAYATAADALKAGKDVVLKLPAPFPEPALPPPVPLAAITDPLNLESSVEDGRQFAKTFSMVTPSAERKRVVGVPCRFREHKQGRSGRKAVRAGYQMKRGLVPPLFSHEVEPGEALRLALDFIHPFTEDFQLDGSREKSARGLYSTPSSHR